MHKASPCCDPPLAAAAAAATREPRPWRRGPRARAAWLCEERKSWAAAGRLGGRPRHRLQLASLPDGGRKPRDSATIPEAPRKASGAPRAPPVFPPPFPLPSILEPGKEATRVLPSLPVTRKPLTTGTRQERRSRNTPCQARLKKDDASVRGTLLFNQSPRWRQAVT